MFRCPMGQRSGSSYDPPPATGPPSTSMIARLVKVELLGAGGTPIDSVSYGYGDARFPSHITSISDFNGNQVASYTYDSRGRGISSSLAAGSDAYSISNTETPTERIRSVTNPLGKVTEYHFQLFGSGTQDIRLAGVVGEASSSTPTSTRSITYGTNNFIASETDEDGHVTTYTRDTRGRPLTVVEASGTSQQRTTTITWDAAFNVPDRVTRGGLQIDYAYFLSGQLQSLTETDTTAQSIPVLHQWPNSHLGLHLECRGTLGFD